MERMNEQNLDVIDLADVARSVRNGWLTIVSCVVLGVIAAAGVLIFVPPVFTGKASVVMKTGGATANLSGLASAMSSLAEATGSGGGAALPTAKPSVETEMEILNSRALAAQVVDSL